MGAAVYTRQSWIVPRRWVTYTLPGDLPYKSEGLLVWNRSEQSKYNITTIRIILVPFAAEIKATKF